jgi:hypothetical protein
VPQSARAMSTTRSAPIAARRGRAGPDRVCCGGPAGLPARPSRARNPTRAAPPDPSARVTASPRHIRGPARVVYVESQALGRDEDDPLPDRPIRYRRERRTCPHF